MPLDLFTYLDEIKKEDEKKAQPKKENPVIKKPIVIEKKERMSKLVIFI